MFDCLLCVFFGKRFISAHSYPLTSLLEKVSGHLGIEHILLLSIIAEGFTGETVGFDLQCSLFSTGWCQSSASSVTTLLTEITHFII